LIAQRRQERKEKYLLTCPNLAAFAPLREIILTFLAALPHCAVVSAVSQ
jgi:hypothetical protein